MPIAVGVVASLAVDAMRSCQPRDNHVVDSPVVERVHGEHLQRFRLERLVVGRTRPAQDVFLYLPGALEVAELLVAPGKAPRRLERPVLVAEADEEPHALFEEGLRPFEVVFEGQAAAEPELVVRDSPVVTELAMERDRLLASKPRGELISEVAARSCAPVRALARVAVGRQRIEDALARDTRRAYPRM